MDGDGAGNSRESRGNPGRGMGCDPTSKAPVKHTSRETPAGLPQHRLAPALALETSHPGGRGATVGQVRHAARAAGLRRALQARVEDRGRDHGPGPGRPAGSRLRGEGALYDDHLDAVGGEQSLEGRGRVRGERTVASATKPTRPAGALPGSCARRAGADAPRDRAMPAISGRAGGTGRASRISPPFPA